MEGLAKKLHCCERCQLFWTCETKWYRGERGEENICCDLCDYYEECMAKLKEEIKPLPKKRGRRKKRK